jgi:catalase
VDAVGARDAKAGSDGEGPGGVPPDPRVLLLLSEAYRHAKPIGGWDGAAPVFEAAGVRIDAPGVQAGEDAEQVLTATIGLLGQHRVWERFPATASGS